MIYEQQEILKNGKTLYVRNAVDSDAEEYLRFFMVSQGETDFQLTYPEENVTTVEQEAGYFRKETDSPNEIALIATVDGKMVGSAYMKAVGSKYKVRHRAEYGIGILKEYWGIGIGRAMTRVCIECARKAGYVQLELIVVSENERAISLYKSFGFEEYGRNPMGFLSKNTGYQETIEMRLVL